MTLDSRALHTESAGSTYGGRTGAGSYSAVSGSRSRRRPRRRVVLPVSEIEGAEVQLPAMPVLRQVRRLVALVLMAALVMLGYSFLTSSRYMVSMPVVTGGSMLSDVQVSSIAGVRGKPLILVDAEAVQKRLESYPEILTAEIVLAWPNVVKIRIQERVPVLSWSDSGRVWWISADGIAFLGREGTGSIPHLVSSESVLEIHEDAMEPVVDPAVVAAVGELTSMLPELQEFTFDIEHGLGFTDPRGWQAYFGRGGDLHQKIVVYGALTAHLEGKEISPELVSVEQVEAPYYR